MKLGSIKLRAERSVIKIFAVLTFLTPLTFDDFINRVVSGLNVL